MEEKGLCIRQPGELHGVVEQLLVQQNTQGHCRTHREQVPEELHEDHLKALCGRQESEEQGKLVQLVKCWTTYCEIETDTLPKLWVEVGGGNDNKVTPVNYDLTESLS